MGSCNLRLNLLLFVVSFITVCQISCGSSNQIQILSAERKIELTSHIVRVYLTLKVENSGASPVSEINVALTPSQVDHLAFIKASAVEGKKKKKTHLPLEVNSIDSSDTPHDAKLFAISLSNPLQNSETKTLELYLVFTHSLVPFPEEIGQSSIQFVHYHDSAFILSPYRIKEQTTFIKIPSSRIESYTKVEPSNHAGTELKYGQYIDRPPFSSSPILLHFENNNAFAVVEELVREIEISHWGSIQVKEHYRLTHAGARHKGVFSRLDYQSKPSISGKPSFKNLLAKLPPRVHSVYYRDSIGNISSSHLRGDSRKSELEIEPRYPMFGGWKATFVIGYGLPLQDFLFNSDDGRRFLNFNFGCPLVETVVDKLTVKVVLPEGSKSPSATIPFYVQQNFEISYSYLDVVGRTVVILTKENVVPDHNVPFQVHYSFNPVFMLAEPLMLTLAFFLFFIACIAYLHIDLSIRKS